MKTNRFFGFPCQIMLGLLLLLVTILGQAQSVQKYLGILESPSPDAFVSGLWGIRGWVCEVDESVKVVSVEVKIYKGDQLQQAQQAAYGVTRGDTINVCGDIDNGFITTVNWGQYGDGLYTVRVFVKGIEFDNGIEVENVIELDAASFTVTTLGTDFLTGASGEYVLADFPQSGNTTTVRWSEAHQNFIIVDANLSLTPQQRTFQYRTSQLQEIPSEGSFESGIGLIQGWVCNAESVEVSIDGGPRVRVGYGIPRPDTAGSCGGEVNNGYAIAYNWNPIGDGDHTLQAFADGVEFANVNFTVTTLGAAYLVGLNGEYTLPDFPKAGDQVTIRWSGADQNFVIVDYVPGEGDQGGTQCSTLGDNTRRYLPDLDIFQFEGTKGEQVLITLDADPFGTYTGERATLTVTDHIAKAWLFRIDQSALPNQITATLPATGAYRISVLEQLPQIPGKPFTGNYCLTMESSGNAYETLRPASLVE